MGGGRAIVQTKRYGGDSVQQLSFESTTANSSPFPSPARELSLSSSRSDFSTQLCSMATRGIPPVAAQPTTLRSSAPLASSSAAPRTTASAGSSSSTTTDLSKLPTKRLTGHRGVVRALACEWLLLLSWTELREGER